MKKKYLIIASHPDDETLGGGATIYSLRKKKNDVRVIFLGEGSTCRFNLNTNKEILSKAIAQRKKFCLKALKTLKVKSYFFYDLPCGKFDQIPMLNLSKIVEKEIGKKDLVEKKNNAIIYNEYFKNFTVNNIGFSRNKICYGCSRVCGIRSFE